MLSIIFDHEWNEVLVNFTSYSLSEGRSLKSVMMELCETHPGMTDEEFVRIFHLLMETRG